MSRKNHVRPMDAQYVDSTTIAINRWDELNVGGMEGPCIWFKISNDSHTDVFISFNGDDDHLFVPSFTKLSHNIQFNCSLPSLISKIKKGLILYVRGYPDKSGGGPIVFTGYY